jgi:hypothetical protein
LNSPRGDVNSSDQVLERTNDFIRFLGVSATADDEIVEYTGKRLVIRWWKPCSTLEACQKLALDIREVCK